MITFQSPHAKRPRPVGAWYIDHLINSRELLVTCDLAAVDAAGLSETLPRAQWTVDGEQFQTASSINQPGLNRVTYLARAVNWRARLDAALAAVADVAAKYGEG